MTSRLMVFVAITLYFAGCDNGHKSINDEAIELKKVIPPFPSRIKGEVTFTWHIATDPSYEMIFLKEYGELEFL